MPQPDALGPLFQAAASISTAIDGVNALNTQLSDLGGRLAAVTAQLATARAAALPTGVIRYYQLANSNWDQYTASADPAMRAAISGSLDRIATYSPYFDDKLSWMPRAHVYMDSYAIGTNDPIAGLHPDWVLHDSMGRKMFIPYACANGTCPQFAADISNPGFIAWRIDSIKPALAPGYIGLFFDDTNMALSVGNGAGTAVAPVDRATGRPMTLTAWQTYFARFLAAVRAAFPSIEIVHNSVWTAGSPATNPLIAAQMSQADIINVERGFGDPGLTGGTGQFSLSALMNFIDAVHSIGKAVVIEDYFIAGKDFSLACYFLVQNGRDFIGFADSAPADLTPMNLGPALGPRYVANGLWRRDFINGYVLVNEPGAAAVTVGAVTVGTRQGGIFLNAAR